MKSKLFGLIAILLVSTATTMAQFHIGVKAGANITKIEGKSFKEQFRSGYHAGAFAEIGFGKKFGIQPEVMFNQYSTTVDSNFSHIYQNVFNPGYASNIKLNYLTVPLLLTYKFLGPLSLQAGPQFGVLIDQNKTLLQNGHQAFKNGDFSVVAGAQLKLLKFRLTGRYVVGLNNINDIDNQDKWKNQTIQLSLGLAL